MDTTFDKKQWFREAGFGMMVHFGLYSLLGGEWRGRRMGTTIGEWAQSYFRIPNDTYHRLQSAFDPLYFDADEWIRTARDAGMKYFVITSKHHEGFALFDTHVSDFKSTASPAGRDIIYECADACAKYGVKLGLYYSQCLDWSHPHGGGYGAARDNLGMSWSNDWDFPDKASRNYSLCYEEKIKPQVKEILTQYGELCLVWFDTPFDISAAESMELYNMVRQYQPDCLVNSRIGNGVGDYESAGDNEIPTDKKDRLFETPATLNDTWGYKSYDNNWKSAETVKKTREHLRSLGANYLLNIGPDHLGRMPAPAWEIMRELAK